MATRTGVPGRRCSTPPCASYASQPSLASVPACRPATIKVATRGNAVAAGLQTPSRGSVEVMGEAMDGRDAAAAAALRARHVGLVFQHLHLLAELTVQENVELPLRLRATSKSQARSQAAELLATFGLA